MDPADFVSEVATRCGVSTDVAERATERTLTLLGWRLDDLHAREVARRLPSRLAAPLLRHAADVADWSLAELRARLAAAEGVDPAFAVEHATVVCQVLTEALDDEGLQHLKAHLPDDLAALFARRPSPISTRPPAPPAPRRPGRTLADGRPGGTHPLSEATTMAQPDSLAATDEPYADRKLSSTTRQPPQGGRLSDGRPGSSNPLSG